MSETENTLQDQKPKTSKKAIASFVLAVIAFVITFDFFTFMRINLGHFPCINILVAGLSVMLSVIFAYTAGVEIQQSDGLVKGIFLGAIGAVLSLIVLLVVFATVFFNRQIKSLVYGGGRIEAFYAAKNLKDLYRGMRVYAHDFDGRYPIADKWCDLLIEYVKVDKHEFLSTLFDKPYYYYTSEPNEEPNASVDIVFEGEFTNGAGESYCKYSVKLCHYAINPNCSPSSPNDVVLLFGTEGGWNQHGGPELTKFDHHKGKKCVVLFNNGRGKFIKPKQVSELKWKVEEDNSIK